MVIVVVVANAHTYTESTYTLTHTDTHRVAAVRERQCTPDGARDLFLLYYSSPRANEVNDLQLDISRVARASRLSFLFLSLSLSLSSSRARALVRPKVRRRIVLYQQRVADRAANPGTQILS